MQEQLKEKVKYPQMQVLEPEYCKLQVHYIANPSVVETKTEEALQTLRKVKIPGFRQGKAPDQAIKLKLKPQIDNYVANAMASHAIDDIVFEHDVKIISQPQFSNVTLHGKTFHCDIELYKKPSFELGNTKFDLTKPKQEHNEDELVEKSLYNLQLRLGEMEPYEENDVVELNDQVTLSFEATIDGNSFDGSVVEGEMYQIGQNRWNGFDNYLIGMKIDEPREFDFVFDNGPLIGKTAHFTVSIHMGTKQKPHEINSEFFGKLGIENKETLMIKLKEISTATLKRNEITALRGEAAKKLVEQTQFDVPSIMVERESNAIAANSGVQDIKTLSETELNMLKEQAKKNIKLSLILDSVREQEPDAILNENEARSHLANNLASQGQDPNKLFNDKNAQFQLAMLLQSIKDEFTLQWVVDQGNVTEEV